ncbi:HD domain-containing protein 2, variant 2 [Balamuthia mandrillaris]
MQASQRAAENHGVVASSGAEGSDAAAAAGASGVLEFLRICGALKTTKRTGWVNSEVHLPESISDHMYRMAVISFLFGNEKGASGLNKEKMIKMALVHDMAEAIVGDITPFDGISKEEKGRAEDEAMRAICSKINGPVGEEMYSLFLEYEQSSTPEAKVLMFLFFLLD